MSDYVSFRTQKGLLEDALRLAKSEGRNRSDAFRDIFKVGLSQKRQKLALEKYGRGEVSVGKAAEMAGTSLWEFIELLSEKKVELTLTASDVLDAAEHA
ncbi:MAG: UPF0175 family protein [Candidatus Micrarchaeia archaeon]|jgi:predicted HTH domain antitoxin